VRWRDVGYWWGTTEAERARSYPCDTVLPGWNEGWYRAVDVAAPPEVVFRWVCQLRAAPYSYDWIDNLGRRSPPHLTPGLESLEVGQRVMSIFELVDFEAGKHLTARLRKPGVFPALAISYCVSETAPGQSRLLGKLVLTFEGGLYHRFVRLLLPWADWIMMRKQLLTLKRYAEASSLAASARNEQHSAQ
jgi:hypothetical protein